MSIPKHTPRVNREAWLTNAVNLMRNRLFAENAFKVPQEVRISVGFPNRGTRGTIGQCFHPDGSGDKMAEIFVHPQIAEPIHVLDIVAHELVHTINHRAGDMGHGKPFRVIAEKIGLEGKMTATTAGSGLLVVLKDYASMLGPYPHAVLEPGGTIKKQGTRLLKGTCPGCGYVIRVTAKWSDFGMPTCICGEEMVLEGEEEDNE